jgi:hypothetical protein
MHGGGRSGLLGGEAWVNFLGLALGGLTKLDGVLTKPFSSYRAVPVRPGHVQSHWWWGVPPWL